MDKMGKERCRGELGEKMERHTNRHSRQAGRRWAVGILSAALAIGWVCPLDGASWFHLQSAKAYEGGTLVVQEGVEVPLSSVLVIKEGGADASQGNDQGTDRTGGLLVFPESETQQNTNESNQSWITESGSRTVSALEEEIVRVGGAYAQVLSGNTAIYTTSLLDDWFAMVDVGDRVCDLLLRDRRKIGRRASDLQLGLQGMALLVCRSMTRMGRWQRISSPREEVRRKKTFSTTSTPPARLLCRW